MMFCTRVLKLIEILDCINNTVQKGFILFDDDDDDDGDVPKW